MDRISQLPDDLLSKTLSYLPTKTAVSTSVLSSRWRSVFQQVSVIDMVWNGVNLEGFLVRVDNMLRGHGQMLVKTFSVSCHGPVSSARANQWLSASQSLVGLSSISLSIDGNPTTPLLLPGYASLANMKIGNNISVSDTLSNSILGSPLLEDFSVLGLVWLGSMSIPSSSLKRLTFHSHVPFHNPNDPYRNPNAMVSFVTPNLVFLDYKDTVPTHYGELSFTSLVEARLDLVKPDGNKGGPFEFQDDVDASDFFKAVSGVKALCLSSTTLTLLSLCEPKPDFQNLIHLAIGCDMDIFWPSMLCLIHCCPRLETLVFQGDFHHCDADANGLHCLYRQPLSTLLKQFGLKNLEFFVDYDVGKALLVVEHFLSHLPHLEKLTVYADDFHLMDRISAFPKASPTCDIIVLPRFP